MREGFVCLHPSLSLAPFPHVLPIGLPHWRQDNTHPRNIQYVHWSRWSQKRLLLSPELPVSVTSHIVLSFLRGAGVSLSHWVLHFLANYDGLSPYPPLCRNMIFFPFAEAFLKKVSFTSSAVSFANRKWTFYLSRRSCMFLMPLFFPRPKSKIWYQ